MLNDHREGWEADKVRGQKGDDELKVEEYIYTYLRSVCMCYACMLYIDEYMNAR